MNNATQSSEKCEKKSLLEHIRSLFSKKWILCPTIHFLNLFFVVSLTLGSVYVYYAISHENSDVKLCIDSKESSQEQEGKMQCCPGSSIAYGLCRVVEKTTQETIIVMLVVLSFLSLKVYCESKGNSNNKKEDGSKERRNNVITVLIATLGVSAIPTGISLIICAFYNMGWMRLLSGVEVYIAFAGISIIAIAFLSVSDEEKGNLGKSSHNLMDMQKGGKPRGTQKGGKS